MMVEELRLRNFKSHRDTVLRLGEGISVIVGENGSGKSSLLEAISFALFKDKPRGVNIAELITRGQESMEVSVSFLCGGRRYRVVRSSGTRSGSRLYCEGSGILEQDRRVTEEIERLTGMNAKLFKSAVYIQQGEIDALLSDDPAVRKRMLAKLLGIERIEQAYERMREVIRAFESKLAELGWVDGEIENAEKKAEVLGREIRAMEDRLRVLEAQKQKAEEELESLRSLRELAERGCRLKLRLEKAEAETKGAEEELRRIREYEQTLMRLEDEERRFREAEKQAKELDARIRELGEKRSRMVSIEEHAKRYRGDVLRKQEEVMGILREASEALGVRVESAEGFRKAAERKMEELAERLRELEQEKGECERRVAEARTKKRELAERLRELEQAGSRCPLCWSRIDEAKREELTQGYLKKIGDAEEMEERWRRKLESCMEEERYLRRREKRLAGMSVRVQEVQRLTEEIESLSTRVKDMEKEAERLRRDTGGLERLMEQRRKLEAEIEALEEAHSRYVSAQEYLRRYGGRKREIEHRLKRLAGEADALRRELEAVKERLGEEPERSRSALVSRCEKAERSLRELERSIWKCRGELNSRKEERKAVEERLGELRSKAEERRKLERFIELLAEIRQAFSRDCLQRELREAAMPLIEQHTREIFQEFNLPYTELMLSDDLSVTLYGPLGMVSTDMLSGGERVALALALRLGIARALAGGAMELIMLDEPTVHLDVQRRQELVEVVRKLSAVPQTVVVTHDWEFEQAADVLIVVEKKNGVSRVRVNAPQAEAGYQGAGSG